MGKFPIRYVAADAIEFLISYFYVLDSNRSEVFDEAKSSDNTGVCLSIFFQLIIRSLLQLIILGSLFFY